MKLISEIYYFSGTGNSLALSRKVNDALGEKSKIMAIPRNADGIVTSADRVGIVFPVYYHNVPNIVKHFVEGMAFEKTPYIFAIATCNVNPGHSLFSIEQELKKKGQTLALGMVAYMPGNAKINTPKEENKKLLDSDIRATEIANYIENQKSRIEGNNGFGEYIWSGIEKSIATGIFFTPKHYKVSSACVACGICEKVCPVKNIRRENGYPVWKSRCENCLACFHWCLKEAISLDNPIIKSRRKYHHPEIVVKDMFYDF